MKIDFTGQTVLITGATMGIGQITADLFAENGANLILTGIETDLIEKFNKEYEGSRKYFYVDFTKTDSIENLCRELDNFPRIDVLINNAGINIIDDFIETQEKHYDLIMNINVKGPYTLSKYIARRMKENNYGRIVNLASIWSKISRPKRALYTMSKNAVYGLTQTMAIELAQFNILVNAISPGFTLTELTARTNTKEEIEYLSSFIPIKRMAEPVEQAKTIAFLASNLNTYITGQNIAVDGGYTIV